jgi:hypothetical protein
LIRGILEELLGEPLVTDRPSVLWEPEAMEAGLGEERLRRIARAIEF